MSLLDTVSVPRSLAAARQLTDAAADVRARVTLLGTAAAACRWDGDGAWAFRFATDATLTRLRRAAALLDEAGEALRRHAVAVQAALDERAEEQARRARELVGVLHELGR